MPISCFTVCFWKFLYADKLIGLRPRVCSSRQTALRRIDFAHLDKRLLTSPVYLSRTANSKLLCRKTYYRKSFVPKPLKTRPPPLANALPDLPRLRPYQDPVGVLPYCRQPCEPNLGPETLCGPSAELTVSRQSHQPEVHSHTRFPLFCLRCLLARRPWSCTTHLLASSCETTPCSDHLPPSPPMLLGLLTFLCLILELYYVFVLLLIVAPSEFQGKMPILCLAHDRESPSSF